MNLHVETNLAKFADRTRTFLGQEALVNSFPVGMIRRYLELEKSMALLVSLTDSKGSLVAVGLQTEVERPMIIAKTDLESARQLAELLASQQPSLFGVNGPSEEADAFAQAWCRSKDQSSKVLTFLRLFQLNQVFKPQAPEGFARDAKSDDREFLFHGLRKFYMESAPHDPQPSDEDLWNKVDESIRRGHYFIWEKDGKPVSFVGSQRETETEKWIAPVYTPPELRGHGFASALTAFVSQKILDLGKRGMLFTDLMNPTSNSIYQKIGYRPIADFKLIGFT